MVGGRDGGGPSEEERKDPTGPGARGAFARRAPAAEGAGERSAVRVTDRWDGRLPRLRRIYSPVGRAHAFGAAGCWKT